MNSSPAPTRHRATLLAMFALTILPFGLAALYYEYIRGDTSIATSNNGRFIQPAALLRDLQLQPLGGDQLAPRKWRLLMYRPAQCANACALAERNLRAMPVLFGRDGGRVQIALITNDASTSVAPPAITVLRADGRVQNIRDGLLLVDPLDNVVLWYSYAQVDKPLLEDMRHLLKVSEFG